MTAESKTILVPLDERITRGFSTHRRDIKDRETTVTFTFSPQVCSDLCNHVLYQNVHPAIEEDPRPFVCFTPVIGYGNDGGWDSDTAFSIPFLSRKPSSESDQYVSWGVTEKIEQEQIQKLTAISNLGLPAFVQIASIGLLEELDIDPCDVKVTYPKPGIQTSITSDDLDVVIKKKFSVDFFPLGIIHNKKRAGSPICAVVPAVINSNRGFDSRENLLPLTLCGYPALNQALLEVAAQVGDLSIIPQPRVDTWGHMVAMFWLENFDTFEDTRAKLTYSIYLDEFLQLESAILGNEAR